VVCLAPPALGDSVRRRRPADASVRPLNFTVRSHFGKISVAKNGRLCSTWCRTEYCGRAALQASSISATECARGLHQLRYTQGARPSGLGTRQTRLVRCAPGADRLRFWGSGGALNRRTMSPSLAGFRPYAHSGVRCGDF